MSSTHPSPPENPDTRTRLLEAASEVFAENGYQHATFREICSRAGANNAAVNYHFRDKAHLYRAVVENALEQAQPHLASGAIDPAAPPEQRLRSFIRSLLFDTLGKNQTNRLQQLMAFEMIQPTPVMDIVAEKIMIPLRNALLSILGDLLGPGADPVLVEDCSSSIFAQCMSYRNSRAAIHRVTSYKDYDEATIEHLSEHVARFSLAALRVLARPSTEPPCPAPAGDAS